MDQDQLLAVLPNVVSSSRFLPVLKAKQSPSVGSPVFENWADQMETELSPSLVSGAASGVSTWFFGCKVSIKRQYEAVLLSLEAAFLVELTSSIHLATLKIAKSLVISESGFPSAAVVLHDVLLGVSTADIKTVFSVFDSINCVVLKPAGIWCNLGETKAVTTYLGHFYRNLHQIQAIQADYFTVPQILNQFIYAVTNTRDFKLAELKANYAQAINLVINGLSDLDSKLKQLSDSINQKLEEYLADNYIIY
ncbi:hypothetical protein G9A89_005407 [Geosiphon pyriformis]|nr:hypothetical protein G9A89_005407 [Geosiphon pyriformis]